MAIGFSCSDLRVLATDAAMGPVRRLGDDVRDIPKDQIAPIKPHDFKASLTSIRPSVSEARLVEHEKWADQYGERGE